MLYQSEIEESDVSSFPSANNCCLAISNSYAPSHKILMNI